MFEDKKRIGREELIERIVAGERYFSNIYVGYGEPNLPGSGLSLDLMIKLYKYLATQNFEKNPIIFSDSDLTILSFDYKQTYYLERREFKKKFKPLNLSYIKGTKTSFPKSCSHVSFHKADLSYANFSDTNLYNCDFSEANLYMANFCTSFYRVARGGSGTDLRKSNLKRANVEGTNFDYTDFSEADIRDIKNLEKSKNLENAKFYNTIVNPREKKIVEEILEKEKPRWKLK